MPGSCSSRAGAWPGSAVVKAACPRSFADKTVRLIQCVDASTGNQSIVLDAGQESVSSARYVNCAEGSGGVNEAMGVASGSVVVAGDLPGVVDAQGRGSGGEWKVDGGEHAGLKQKAVGA